MFPLYCQYYQEDDAKLKWLQREHVFKVPHKFLESKGVTKEAILTGMRDGDYRNPIGGLGLFETKTKSSIDDVAIQSGLRADLQTMLYLYSLRREYREEPGEILYNVIRRPQLRQKGNESLQAYGQRLTEDIKERPAWYFRRFEVTVLPGDLETFVSTTLDPVLRCLLEWWESIKDHPFDRWRSPYHYRNLAALTTGWGTRAPLYDLMILGNKSQYFRRSSPFPELEGSFRTAA
jgi:hypothetical protein